MDAENWKSLERQLPSVLKRWLQFQGARKKNIYMMKYGNHEREGGGAGGKEARKFYLRDRSSCLCWSTVCVVVSGILMTLLFAKTNRQCTQDI